MNKTERILSRFPKVRSELPAAFGPIYAEHYRRNREGLSAASSLSKRAEAWMHRKVAQDLKGSVTPVRTLEIGAGNLNHLAYESERTLYDVVEALPGLPEKSPHRNRVQNVYRSVNEIPNQQYDRIVSIAVFEHFCDLPLVVARCGLLLAPMGRIRIGIPSEGTILWRIGWSLTTGIEFRLRYGLNYGVLMRHEHVNTAVEIEAVLRYFFREVDCSFFGLNAALSFYQFFEGWMPDLQRCQEIFERTI